MLQIPKDFPQLKQVILKQNYRCTGEIVEKSQNVIRWNDARYEKQLFTENDKGKPLEIRTFENESEETTWLLKQIQKDLAEGCPHKEIAILFRTNHNCRMTVERLMENTGWQKIWLLICVWQWAAGRERIFLPS